MLVRVLLVVAAFVAAPLLPGASTGAAAAPASACSSSTGVLVVVDLRSFGGALTRGCDPSPSTGLDALHAAGYTTEGTRHDGPAFVCRIDGHPSAKQEPCVNTPPANSYWSYWHADAGQSSWAYSTLGAQSYHPEPGSVDAWVFGSTNVAGTSGGPAFTPTQARGARSTGGSPSAETGSRSSSRAPRPGAAPPTPRGGATSSTASSSPTSSSPATSSTGPVSISARPGATPTSPTGAPPSTTAEQPSFADASSVARTSSSGGSPWPVILGFALVLLLGAGGGWGVLRRRRADAADH